MGTAPSPSKPLLRKMVARDPNESHRAATPLELLFDLCFVVAIAQLAGSLHHAITHGHALAGAGAFVMVFLAIWWAWMGLTWFASTFDTDDALYRIKVFVQMVGVLVVAAGVRRAFEDGDFTFITLGYVIMRIGLVALWLRASRAGDADHSSSRRYALGISVLQILWIGLLAVPSELWLYGWAALILLELLVPMWARRVGRSSWHSHHIAERYGLMTIIVIGESVLAATLAIQSAVDLGSVPAGLVQVIIAAPVTLFAMWWLYFSQPGHAVVTTTVRAFVWGYGHYFVFASAAAVGAGLAVAVDLAMGKAEISEMQAAFAIAIPVAIYLVSVWFVQVRPQPVSSGSGKFFLVAAASVLAAPLTPSPALVIALVLATTTCLVVRAVHRSGIEA